MKFHYPVTWKKHKKRTQKWIQKQQKLLTDLCMIVYVNNAKIICVWTKFDKRPKDKNAMRKLCFKKFACDLKNCSNLKVLFLFR